MTASLASLSPDFGLSLEQLRGRQNAKWNKYGADVIPAWVAEMDFEPSPAIQEAVDRLARTHDYGYPLRAGDKAELTVSQAFVKRMQARFGWAPERSTGLPCRAAFPTWSPSARRIASRPISTTTLASTPRIAGPAID